MAEGGNPDLGNQELPSQDERNILHALHLLGIQPKLGDSDTVQKLIAVFGNGTEIKKEPEDNVRQGTHHFPKLSVFYGEPGKGEASWDTFRYELEALKSSGCFTEEQILLGVRRSLKGSAGDKLRRLGTKASLDDVMTKLESDYGTVESKESIMRKFYSCFQKPDETVETYASRLEDLFDKAVQLRGLRRTDNLILKEVFHAGLKKDLKMTTLYCKGSSTYEDLKRELRHLELDMKPEESDQKRTCKAAVNTDKTEKKNEGSDMSELKEMLKQINSRIDQLEKKGERDSDTSDLDYQPRYNNYRGRGYGGRGRGNYRPNRPLGSNQFQPKCYICKEDGHVQRNCPVITSQFVCPKCEQKGHRARDCPN